MSDLEYANWRANSAAITSLTGGSRKVDSPGAGFPAAGFAGAGDLIDAFAEVFARMAAAEPAVPPPAEATSRQSGADPDRDESPSETDQDNRFDDVTPIVSNAEPALPISQRDVPQRPSAGAEPVPEPEFQSATETNQQQHESTQQATAATPMHENRAVKSEPGAGDSGSPEQPTADVEPIAVPAVAAEQAEAEATNRRFTEPDRQVRAQAPVDRPHDDATEQTNADGLDQTEEVDLTPVSEAEIDETPVTHRPSRRRQRLEQNRENPDRVATNPQPNRTNPQQPAPTATPSEAVSGAAAETSSARHAHSTPVVTDGASTNAVAGATQTGKMAGASSGTSSPRTNSEARGSAPSVQPTDGQRIGPADRRETRPANGSTTDTTARIKLVQRVSRAFQHLGPDGGMVRLRLAPAELGSVRVEMRVNKQSIQARVVAETEAASATLREHLPDLRLRLESYGLQVERIDVETEPRDERSGLPFDRQPQHREDQQQGRQPWQQRRPSADSADQLERASSRPRPAPTTVASTGVDLRL